MQGGVFIGSLFIERSPGGDRILPRVAVNVDTPVSELLFARTRLLSGTAYIQTSTWFISRELLLQIPFTQGLRRNQDADWMLHALTRPLRGSKYEPSIPAPVECQRARWDGPCSHRTRFLRDPDGRPRKLPSLPSECRPDVDRRNTAADQ